MCGSEICGILTFGPVRFAASYYETSGRVVKYYENIRFVYEIQSRVRQFKQATRCPERPENAKITRRKDKTKNNTSGQPEQNRNATTARRGASRF